MNDPGPFDRLSSYLAGLGLGICASAVLAASYLQAGHNVPWGLCLAWAVGGAGALPAVEWAARFLFAVILAILEIHERRERARPASPQTAIPPAPSPEMTSAAGKVEFERHVPYNDMGRAKTLPIVAHRSARWWAWQAAALAYLQWVDVKHGSTAAHLVGPFLMFGDRGDWVVATNGFRDAGLVEKANGTPTTLKGTVDEARARALAGDYMWPADRDPPSYRPTLIEFVPDSLTGAES